MATNSSIQKIRYQDKLTWLSIVNPTEAEINHLKRSYKFHHLDLEDCLSENQRPKIDEYDDYLFIVLHIPTKPTRRRQIRLMEVDVFIGQNFVITLHDGDSTLETISNQCRKNKKTREDFMSKGSGYFLYRIINELFESCFPLSDEIAKQVNEMETEVFDYLSTRDRLQEILLLKKDIINFRRIIMPQRTILAQLEHKNKKFLPENLDVYFDDIVDKIERMWNSLENLQELVISLQETNESIISHNTNNIIKVLTLFSVIMLPLTFITGFYGMNVDGLPFASHPLAPEFVSGVIIGVVLIMIIYFRYKKWF